MMAIKRALVVDDSRSARVSLKLLLEEHDLEVDLAESGEDALEFLKKEDVDVIFMDHTMPGMDGLEAVAAIKANPRTATIPVMMYTTREGEVYVGQARALGAVGVMPKNVQKHQLFDMLVKLGLVHDRRTNAQSAQTPQFSYEAQPLDEAQPLNEAQPLHAVVDEIDRELDEQAMGISLQAVVRRILEDQHLTLRSDILRQQKVFAKEVAREVLKEHLTLQARSAEVEDQDVVDEQTAPRRPRLAMAAAVVFAAVSGFLAWQFKTERDLALDQLVALETSRADVIARETAALTAELSAAQDAGAALSNRALAAFEFSVNAGNTSSMHEDAFSATLADKVRELLPLLKESDFRGEIRLTSHLGRFCLEPDDSGRYQLAPANLPAAECAHTGHILEDSTYVSDRLSVEFSELVREVDGADVRLTLEALDSTSSERRVEYPGIGALAGEWNDAARNNNRVEVRLYPDLSLARN